MFYTLSAPPDIVVRKHCLPSLLLSRHYLLVTDNKLYLLLLLLMLLLMLLWRRRRRRRGGGGGRGGLLLLLLLLLLLDDGWTDGWMDGGNRMDRQTGKQTDRRTVYKTCNWLRMSDCHSRPCILLTKDIYMQYLHFLLIFQLPSILFIESYFIFNFFCYSLISPFNSELPYVRTSVLPYGSTLVPHACHANVHAMRRAGASRSHDPFASNIEGPESDLPARRVRNGG